MSERNEILLLDDIIEAALKINKYRRTNKTAYTLGISNETKIKIKIH